MTNREFHLQCRKNETLAFHRVLNALPHEKFHYSPHEKSQSASKIIWTLIGESNACSELIDKSEFTFGQPPDLPPPHMLEAFEKAWDTLLQKVEKMDDAAWDRKGRFMMNGQVRMEQPIGAFLWLFFFDAIHHRGHSRCTSGRWAARCRDLRTVRRRSDDVVGEPPEDG